MSSIISRHFDRINGEGLILFETSMWYQYVGAEKSKEMYNLYKDKEVPVSETNYSGATGSLSEFILCKNGDILKKRKKPKIVMYPNLKGKTKFDIMYARCLLFFPILSEDELLEPNLEDKFMMIGKDGTGTIIEENERKLLKFKLEAQEDDIQLGDDVEDEEDNDALDNLLDALEDQDSNENIYHGEDGLDLLLEILEND